MSNELLMTPVSFIAIETRHTFNKINRIKTLFSTLSKRSVKSKSYRIDIN